MGWKCRLAGHEWSGPYSAEPTDVYGRDYWTGVRSELPVSRHTDVSAICGRCGEPLKRRFQGTWANPGGAS